MNVVVLNMNENFPKPYLEIDSTDEAEILTTRINDHDNLMCKV